MKIYFNENLKRLRKEKGLSQEELATFLTVSFQTISKWERGESYPDIETLPEIAKFFGVSTDDLLSADKTKNESKLKTYISLYDNMQLKEVSYVLSEYENAVKDFPHDFSILIRYMELLHIEKGSVRIKDYNPLSDKLISTYNKIQKFCTDDNIRIRSKRIMLQHLMWQYQCLGFFDNEQKFDGRYKKQAEAIFNTLPSLNDSKEYNLLYFDFDNKDFGNSKRLANRENLIEELSYLLQNVIIEYCYYDDGFSTETKINIILNMNGIFRLIDTKDHPTKNRIHIIYNYGHLGYLYAKIGDDENAFKYLRLAAEEAIAFDSLPDDIKQTMLFYEQEKRFQAMNMRDRMYELITKHYPLSEEFKTKEKYQKIVKMLI